MFGKPKGACTVCGCSNGCEDLLDGVACESCAVKCRFLIGRNLKKINNANAKVAAKHYDEMTVRMRHFTPTQAVGKYIEADMNNRLWRVSKVSRAVFKFEDIINFEYIENGNSVTEGGLGSAVVGGVLFGGVGAVVGSNIGKKKTTQEINQMDVKIVTRDEFIPQTYINLLTFGPVKSDSMSYNDLFNEAQRILSLLERIVDTCKKQPVNSATVSTSVADEIAKLKSLLDLGAITDEEFSAGKKKLLGI